MDVTESPRIEELRRRVQKDPTSIAFAQLAEEHRRVGDYQEAVNVCRSGLARHPSYLSARVTLGRALMELEEFGDAQAELEAVLDLAPDNLAAIRALAEIHQRRGDTGETFHESVTTLDPPREEAPPAPHVEDDEPVLEAGAVEADLPASAEATAGKQVGLEPTPALVEQPAAAAPEPPASYELRGLPEALDALGALTLDLPPIPDFSSWSLDTNFSLPDFLPDARPDPLPAEPTIAYEGGPASRDAPEPDHVIGELQQWLAAIVRDRSNEP
jgi:tetratricopeptide (TPR) repeat protein